MYADRSMQDGDNLVVGAGARCNGKDKGGGWVMSARVHSRLRPYSCVASCSRRREVQLLSFRGVHPQNMKTLQQMRLT